MRVHRGVFWGFYSLLLISLVTGCSSLNNRNRFADSLATKGHFKKKIFSTRKFRLVSYIRTNTHLGRVIPVYIEGDGKAWVSRYRISSDPTPVNPVSLKLAIHDPSDTVVFLARPCQYQTGQMPPECHPRYWTSERYSEAVVASMNQALNSVRQFLGLDEAVQFALVGYSGGGGLAVLLAARRNDIAWFATVAANLDHREWTRLHGDSALTGSLNAIDFAEQVADLPQHHFAGGDDETVPASIIQRFIQRAGLDSTRDLTVIPEYDHQCCWVKSWPGFARILERLPDRKPDQYN